MGENVQDSKKDKSPSNESSDEEFHTSPSDPTDEEGFLELHFLVDSMHAYTMPMPISTIFPNE